VSIGRFGAHRIESVEVGVESSESFGAWSKQRTVSATDVFRVRRAMRIASATLTSTNGRNTVKFDNSLEFLDVPGVSFAGPRA